MWVVARLIVLGLYLGALVDAVLLFNDDAQNGVVAWAIWMAASPLLAFAVGRWEVAFLPLIAIPLAIPFDYSDEYLGSDSSLVWFFAAAVWPQSAGSIAAGVALRRWSDRRRRRRSPDAAVR